MKTSVIIATTILALASSTGVYAKGITGTIKSVDKQGDAITLTSGRVFRLPERIEVQRFTAGEKVKINYHTTKAGRTTVSSVQPTM
jgi:hypothetical protein